MPHEHRGDRAARHGRRDEELTVLEAELDDVPSEREVADCRDAVALRRHVTQLFEHRLVAIRRRMPVEGPGSRRCRIRSLCPDHTRGAREQQGQGEQDRRRLGHAALAGLDRMNHAASQPARYGRLCGREGRKCVMSTSRVAWPPHP